MGYPACQHGPPYRWGNADHRLLRGEQSWTAVPSSVITGQSGVRTGLSKAWLPGADTGLRQGRTIAS